MSLYVRNQQCDMCREVEKTLCRINVGKIDHMICYGCMAKLTVDLVEFASMNLVDEMEQMGVDIAEWDIIGVVDSNLKEECFKRITKD